MHLSSPTPLMRLVSGDIACLFLWRGRLIANPPCDCANSDPGAITISQQVCFSGIVKTILIGAILALLSTSVKAQLFGSPCDTYAGAGVLCYEWRGGGYLLGQNFVIAVSTGGKYVRASTPFGYATGAFFGTGDLILILDAPVLMVGNQVVCYGRRSTGLRYGYCRFR